MEYLDSSFGRDSIIQYSIQWLGFQKVYKNISPNISRNITGNISNNSYNFNHLPPSFSSDFVTSPLSRSDPKLQSYKTAQNLINPEYHNFDSRINTKKISELDSYKPSQNLSRIQK